ncbi:rRNA-processing protein CGR1 [Metschnikowia aff. pulcherrima]|uniref:rRNA-processing protein CGR1 n=2 Tax=Metschnikowia TaxID=27320 RepID=A0A4P6XH99_9ASCO|nr:rRNA-processing protein CGR1 [Metschnikowia aff. pulcherrima]
MGHTRPPNYLFKSISSPRYLPPTKMSATSEKQYKDIPKKFIDPLVTKDEGEGTRVNGKDWKMKKDAFRLRSAGVRKLNTWKLREEKKLKDEQFKQRINSLKQEKADERKKKIDERKQRIEAIAEKERYEKIAQKMHAKKVERLRKKEKRNKLLRER